jgi:integrase
VTIRKLTNGKFQAIVKSGRAQVGSKVFVLRRDAETWHAAQVRALSLGEFVDPKAGREPLGSVLERWMAARQGTISSTTYKTDLARMNYFPSALLNRPVSSIRAADVEALFGDLMRRDLSKATVTRVRALLSSAFSWATRNKLVVKNVVAETRVPAGNSTKAHEVYPFNEPELRALVTKLAVTGGPQADVALVLGLTGLRWGELVALRVRDVTQIPFPAFRVSRSASDGHTVRATKSGRARTVPLVPEVAKIVQDWAAAKEPEAFLFTSPEGARLHQTNWRRVTEWTKYRNGRRVHDLRHTAATLWLAAGVDAKTCQSWLGHRSMQLTVDLYGHWQGLDSDAAALARVTASLGGAPGVLDTIPDSGRVR